MDDKLKIAEQLISPIARCVGRVDTSHSAFRGCIDWHSAVHGTWSLLAYMNQSGDKRFKALVDGLLTRDNIADEFHLLRRKPHFEMPYGRAWFLRLAIEDSRFTRSDRLQIMANFVFASLVRYFKKYGVNPSSGSYDSHSWALINMLDYARFTNNQDQVRFVEGLVRAHFFSANKTCAYRFERGHFMAVCTNWAWLVGKVMERQQFQLWVRDFFKNKGLPLAVKAPLNAHHYGLNFSRAWGLRGLYELTDDARFLKAYETHFYSTFYQPSHWRGDYRRVGHWVAQFGVFALGFGEV